MAANNDPGIKAGYAAPLEGTDSKIRPMLQDGFTALNNERVASLTASSGAQGPTTATEIASPANKTNPSPTAVKPPAPPRPRDIE